MSVDLHIHFSRHQPPVSQPQGLGELLAQHAQHEAVKALMGAVLMQLMQAMMAKGGQADGPQGAGGAGGAGGSAGAGKAQGLLQEFAQLLSLLSQLAGSGQGHPPCNHSAQGLADKMGGSGGGGQTLDQVEGHGSSSHWGGGTGSVGGSDRSAHDSGEHHGVDTEAGKSKPDSHSGPDHEVKPDKPTHGASGSKPTGQPESTAPTGAGKPSSQVDGPPPMNGEKIVNQTIVVKAGETFDGKGMHFKAGPALGDGGQGESQKPVFVLEPGAKLKNVQLSGADGIHTKGDATLDNVWWRDVGEDAMTMKGEGKVTVNGGGAFNASDKVFQLNHGGSFTLNNFTADTFSKGIRTNGGKDFPIDITVKNSTFRNGEEAVVRSDATQARIKLEGNTIENTKYDVIAPKAAEVEGAKNRGWKDYTG
jgi:hypothetical protein